VAVLALQKTAEPFGRPFGGVDWGGPKDPCIRLYMGATWRLRLNDSCSAAMQAVAAITVATRFVLRYYYVGENSVAI